MLEVSDLIVLPPRMMGVSQASNLVGQGGLLLRIQLELVVTGVESRRCEALELEWEGAPAEIARDITTLFGTTGRSIRVSAQAAGSSS